MIAAVAAGCVCALMGMGARRALIERAAALECWLDALRRMEIELTFARSDLCELLDRCGGGEDDVGRSLQALLGFVAARLRDDPSCCAMKALCEAPSLDRNASWRALHERDRACLRRAMSALEQGTLRERAEDIAHARATLDQALKEARGAGQRNGRLYASLGWLGGVALTLLLI